MRTAAILPVKRFAQAKQRLGASVGDPQRYELAGAMVADVLLALAEVRSIERTIVVTRERSVATAARRQGALVVEDAWERGQSAAVTLGVGRALAEGMERVLCIPGDCPALDPAELESLLDARAEEGRAVVIVPDRHGTGTNGLLLTPPDAILPSFGPDSCERHRALALAAGVTCTVARLPSLLLDIDTGEDLAALRERVLDATAAVAPGGGREGDGRRAGGRERAPRTRAALGQPERTDGLPIKTTA